MRDAILVLGMHRSGTSAIAGVLAKLGAASPRSLMQADERNVRGYFESVLFWHFHDRLLEAAGSSWDDWRPFDMSRLAPSLTELEAEATRLLQEEFGDAPLFVLKDPRICRFVPFWLSLLHQLDITPRVVIPFRSPLEVAESLRTRNGCSVEKGLLLWLRHTIDAERPTRHLPRSCVSMDDLISDWRQCVGDIGRDAGIVWPRFDNDASSSIDAFLSRDLKHHAVADVEQGPARQWVARTYDAMLILAHNPRSKLAFNMIDEVAESIDQAGILFGREYADMRAHAHHLQSELSALAAQRDPSAPRLSPAQALAERAQKAAEAIDFDELRSLGAQTGEVRRKLLRLKTSLAVESRAG